ncbi:(2Fe-2S) ferredoxin domain-containing protein [Acidisoma cellulosilytica]|uniref:(2Fe-2S) ferredoxin domain-containing protein n=1 Tax=Acidisoma cellulosilyticum TaxID=2802395 RepID=A0A963Z1I7_9PROT|nr:(2Fe-2S) ferredoxin domain-containing protein [Acidisoma cellulosilyticum]MCB8881152.1 (2Fe-2S) ferredoxin domain-containing protein [Acidisoma cellulosilyticum]
MSKIIQSRPTPWTSVILLCGKCAGKMKAGFGPDRKQTLREALRTELKAQGQGRQVRIVETRCLGLCPKKAVAALNAHRPERILTIPKGTGTDEALTQLMGHAEKAAD